MKSIKNYKLTISVICCILLASCSLIDFSEDCTYYGDVEIKPDWSGMAKGESKPVLTDIYLLSPQQNYMYNILSDTLVTGIQAAKYKVLAFNSYGISGINFSGMDCPEKAKAELSTYANNGKLYTVQAPDFYTANTALTVIPYEMAICEPALKSAVRQINIDFVVMDDTGKGVNFINGELSGIAYRYGFKESDALVSAARLPFTSLQDREKLNIYSSVLKVFGVNPDKQVTDKIDNLLDIALQTTDGNIFSQTISLTDIFSGFTTRYIHITIEIRLGLLGMDVEVTGWNVSDGGIIEL